MSLAWFRQQLYASSHEQACRVCWRPNTCQCASGNKRINGTYHFLEGAQDHFSLTYLQLNFVLILAKGSVSNYIGYGKSDPFTLGLCLSCRSQSWSHPEMALHNGSRLRPLGITWPSFNNLSIGISFYSLSTFFHLLTQNLVASVFQAFCSALGAQWSVSLEFSFTEDMAINQRLT